jgi:hypothetical protein
MAELSDHQRKIVDRYYDHRDTIMLGKLQELVTELYLAESQKRQDQLWKRVDAAMTNLKVKPPLREHILASRDAELLANHIRDWLKQASG